MKISRRAYAEMFGPTAGDRVRLADTELIIEVEHDHTVYGEEVKFGGGKVIRDGMGQGQRGWIAYRDGQCELYGFEARGGSMEPMLVSGCKADMTRARTKELREFITGPQ